MRQVTIVKVGTSLYSVSIHPGHSSYVIIVESEDERSSKGGCPADCFKAMKVTIIGAIIEYSLRCI
jgi:hypothetical protein